MPIRNINQQKDYKLQERKDHGNVDYNSGGIECCELLNALNPLIWSDILVVGGLCQNIWHFVYLSWIMSWPSLCLPPMFSLMQTSHKDVSTCLESDSYSCVVLTQSLRPLLILTETNVWYFKEKQWSVEDNCRVLCSSIVMLAKILIRLLLLPC